MEKKIYQWASILITLSVAIFTLVVSYRLQVEDYSGRNIKNHSAWLDPDDAVYILYAQQAVKERTWTVKWNTWDNHPEGRPVHWASLNILGLRLLGKLGVLMGQEDELRAIEDNAIFWNPILLCIFGITFSLILIHYLGGYGLIVYLFTLLATSLDFSFMPLHPDHQGLVLMANSLFVFSVLLGYRNKSLLWFSLAGLGLGLSFWLVASSALVHLGLLVLSAFVVLFLCPLNPTTKSTIFNGWWLTGLIGAAVSLIGWGFEYAPTLPIMLEINSPLHSLGILGVCFLVAYAYTYGANHEFIHKRKKQWTLAIIGISLIIGLLSLFVMGSAISALSHPVMGRLHDAIKEMGPPELSFLRVAYLAALMAAGWYLLFKNKTNENLLLVMSFSIILAIMGSGISRLLTPLTIYFLPMLALATSLPRGRFEDTKIRKDSMHMILSIALGIGIWNVGSTMSGWKGRVSQQTRDPVYQKYLTIQKTAVEINNDAQLLGIDPHTLISDAGESSLLAYYLKGNVGPTIYWEAAEGLVNAGKILANADDLKSAEELYNRGFQYIILDPNLMVSLVYAVHGRREATESVDLYQGSRWAKEEYRPDWLTPLEEGSKIYRVDRKELKQWIENYEETPQNLEIIENPDPPTN